MIVIQFGKNFFHNGLAIQRGFCVYTELLAVSVYGSKFAVVKIYNLPVLAYQRGLLLLEILRIHA